LEQARAFVLAASPASSRKAAGEPGATARGHARAARHALVGMLKQLESGRASLREFVPLVSRRGMRREPAVLGLGARARGMRGGKACELVARVEVSVPPLEGGAMAAITGACEALFFRLATTGDGGEAGVLLPQSWVQPQRFYSALATLVSRAGGSFRVSVDDASS